VVSEVNFKYNRKRSWRWPVHPACSPSKSLSYPTIYS